MCQRCQRFCGSGCVPGANKMLVGISKGTITAKCVSDPGVCTQQETYDETKARHCAPGAFRISTLCEFIAEILFSLEKITLAGHLPLTDSDIQRNLKHFTESNNADTRWVQPVRKTKCW